MDGNKEQTTEVQNDALNKIKDSFIYDEGKTVSRLNSQFLDVYVALAFDEGQSFVMVFNSICLFL
ncbi:hypothetical protein BV455_00236 [Parageobacillus caldoxylosilyticus]|nr:hypothetical protein BV455_00236 [Parageobacillus caldoxylosilyticus]